MEMRFVKRTFSDVAAELADGLASGAVTLGADVQASSNSVLAEELVFNAESLAKNLEGLADNWNSRRALTWGVRLDVSSAGASQVVSLSRDLVSRHLLPASSSPFKRLASFLVLSQYYPVFNVHAGSRLASPQEMALWLPRVSLHACEWIWPQWFSKRDDQPYNHLKVELISFLRNYHAPTWKPAPLDEKDISKSILATSLIIESLYYAGHRQRELPGESVLRRDTEPKTDERFVSEVRVLLQPSRGA